MAKIIPGVLTNGPEDYVVRLKRAEAVSDLVQIDVIDGKFAPNNTIGVDVISKYPTSSKLEVQLMVEKPGEFIKSLSSLEYVSRIIFPFETNDVYENIKLVKQVRKQVGLSINPETEVSDISEFAKDLDVLCIFSASPGFSGQKLEDSVYGRINQSKSLYPLLAVEVDIGVNLETAPNLVSAGADFLVATSALHNAPNFETAYKDLAEAALSGHN